ncbi:rod-binding protein [Desulfovibrio sp. OttesenSCG-928-I05]|nr:rod-binding protein [Desulfovibrio sp. OttesenSCG-928-I05]
MLSSPIDTQAVMQSAFMDDPVQKKLAVDSLKKRLGDSRTEDEKLQEACDGFESIFIQKMWEQMRKNVPKEGYLHSKDEETYQSMFDTELAKKMTEAGGIGLAAMLKEQLSQKLSDASRGTTPGGIREPIALATTRESLDAARERQLAAQDLYSPVEEVAAPEPVREKAPDTETLLKQALAELSEELETSMSPESMAAAMAGPAVGRQPHYVAPGAEPRIVASGATPRSTMGRVSAPGKGAPSTVRMPRELPDALADGKENAAPAPSGTTGPQAHPATVAVQAQLAAQAAERAATIDASPAQIGALSDAVSGSNAALPPRDTAPVGNPAQGRGPQPLTAWGGIQESGNAAAASGAVPSGLDLRT